MNTIKVKLEYTNKLSDYLDETITTVIISYFYCLNFEAFIDSRLKTFQFKILQRILATNKFLNKCKVSTENCYLRKCKHRTFVLGMYYHPIILGQISSLFN